jgi:hypothetical protein
MGGKIFFFGISIFGCSMPLLNPNRVWKRVKVVKNKLLKMDDRKIILLNINHFHNHNQRLSSYNVVAVSCQSVG